MKLILALLLALVSVCADAAFDVPMPVAKATFPPPDVQMPAGKIYIDTTTIPASRFGSGDIRLKISCGPLTTTAYGPKGALIGCGGDGTVNAPDHKGDGPTGAFRISCSISHYSFDDPIVWPGQSGRTHLHQFFGNTVTDAQHDASKMETFGNSTCNGGIANRTGYWVPAFVYHCPAGEVGCNRSRDGQIQPTTYNDAYYKSTAASVASFKTTKWWPKGFRMIAGDPNNWEPSRMPLGSRFDCYDANNGTYAFYDHLPNTADAQALPQPCVEVNMMIKFPECSIDDEAVLYQGTPAYPANISGHTRQQTSGCFEAGYTRQHPTITYNIHVPITVADLDYIRLSSDTPATAGVTRAGSTTTSLVLDVAESANANYYVFGSISIAGQFRRITAYNSSTKVATLGSALTSAPAAGTSYVIRTAAGRSMHGDWANGWSVDPNFQGWGRSITDQIIRQCAFDIVRYGDPAVAGSPASTLNLDCHNDILGDPTPSTTPEPHIGGVYYMMY